MENYSEKSCRTMTHKRNQLHQQFQKAEKNITKIISINEFFDFFSSAILIVI